MGRSPTLPVDLLLPPPDQIIGNTEEDLQARFRAVFQFVANAKKAAYRIQARSYTGRVRNFEPGQLAWFFLLDNKAAPISGRKLLNSWSGPMMIVRKEGRSLYRIKADRVPGAREFVAHSTRLFPFFAQDGQPQTHQGPVGALDEDNLVEDVASEPVDLVLTAPHPRSDDPTIGFGYGSFDVPPQAPARPPEVARAEGEGVADQ